MIRPANPHRWFVQVFIGSIIVNVLIFILAEGAGMKKIVVPVTPAQANMLVFALIKGFVAVKGKREARSLAIVALRIADELERVFPTETGRGA